jgi:hypothetical protein
MSFRDALSRKASIYTEPRGLIVVDELGYGVHGIVFVVESQHEKGTARSAVKVHQHEAGRMS